MGKAHAPQARRKLRSPAVWCGLGFMSGAVFWHFAGFWPFAPERILERALSVRAAAAEPSGTARAAEPPVVVVDTNRCTMLMLDRSRNSTRAQRCPTRSLAMRYAPDVGMREDMADFAEPQRQAGGYGTD